MEYDLPILDACNMNTLWQSSCDLTYRLKYCIALKTSVAFGLKHSSHLDPFGPIGRVRKTIVCSVSGNPFKWP